MDRSSRHVERGAKVTRGFAVVALTALVAVVVAWDGERGAATRGATAERALVPLGIDATYNNYDVWIPPGCRAVGGTPIGWTGFTLLLNEPLACIGALYDGTANPFANPPSGVPGVPGTKTSSGGLTIIDWTNAAAPVTASGGLARDGHFGYQRLLSNPSVICTDPEPTAQWHRTEERMSVSCSLPGTDIRLVPAEGSRRSAADGHAVQPPNAEIKVSNLSSRSLSISVAARDWPDDESYASAGTDLLSRLRPDDVLFATHFAGVTILTEVLDPGSQLTYPLLVPDDERVVLAWHSVSVLDAEEEEEEYVVYSAFESDTRLLPLEEPTETPTDEPTAGPTSGSTSTPGVITPTPTRDIFLPEGLYFPVGLKAVAWRP